MIYILPAELETTELVDSLSRDGILFALFNIDHVTDLHALLVRLYLSNAPVNKDIDVVILCYFFCLRRILRTANEFDALSNNKTLLNKVSRWLVGLYGHTPCMSRAIETEAAGIDNIAILAIPEYTSGTIEVFRESLDYVLFDTRNEESSGRQLTLKESITNKLEENAVSWSDTSKCLGYHIDTMLWTDTGRAFSSVGYAEINGNVVVTSDVFPNSKYGYNKRQFLVSTLPYSPFVHKKKKINGSVVYEGLCLDLLNQLASILNFTYRLTEPEDGKWGGFIRDEENIYFNGLAGQLQREEVDVVAAPLSWQPERTPYMDFSYPYYYEYTTILVKKPDVNATKWRTLIDPFKWEVFVAIGAALLIVSLLTFLIEKYNPFYEWPRHAEERQVSDGLHTWHGSFWYILGAWLWKGGVHLPASTTGRTLVSCWWLTCVILGATYSGNLVAFLTVTKEILPFNTVRELLELKGTYTWGTLSGTNWEAAFPSSSNPTFRAIGEAYREFNKTDPDIMHPNPDVHIERVKRGHYAWIGDKTYIDITKATDCSLMSIKETFMPMKYAFAFTKNSPHTAIFSNSILKITERGLLQIWKSKWWPKANVCAGNTITEAKPISLVDVQSAFYMCIIGLFIGLVVFLMELIVYKCRKQKQAQN